MKEKKISEIDLRITQWAEFMIETKQFKSEAELLRSLSLGSSKLSDARKGKAGFRSDDIGIILMKYRNINADWIMTGRGEMLLAEDKMPEHKLIDELKRVNRNYDEIKKERDEWFYKARKYEEELQKSNRTTVKTDTAV